MLWGKDLLNRLPLATASGCGKAADGIIVVGVEKQIEGWKGYALSENISTFAVRKENIKNIR